MPRSTATQPQFVLYLFGAFRLEVRQGTTLHDLRLPRRKVESLLAYLVLHPEPNGHPREKLATLFWGDTPDKQARMSLRTSLTVLRKALGADVLIADAKRVQLNPDRAWWIDVREFDRLRASSPEIALELYGGELLAGFYDEWVLLEREQWRCRYVDTLLQLTQQLRSRSEYEQAGTIARRALEVDRANETAYQHLMFCELARGNRAGAIELYSECARMLQAELAVEPAAETQALYHWLKQTHGPMSIAARITNLPLPLTSFIGRKHELTHVKLLLNQSHLLTLVGAGGSGKTRLAIQVSTELLDAFHDGVWWVELAPLTSAALVPQAVMKALGLSEAPRLTLLETLAEFLRARTVLLVLDNCEHVIDACAELAQTLLQHEACANLKILATSREPLSVPGESVWQVPTLAVPIDLPTPEQMLLSFESVRLFVERAQAANPHFALNEQNINAVTQLCRRLDGIPLALELAAARVNVLAVHEIAARLDDRFNLLTQGNRAALPRQQTLRALVDWSYDLLSDEERVVFMRLSVFVGKFSLAAAEAICADAHVSRARLLDVLARLVSKSLLLVSVDQAEGRFYFLETIREYATDRLDETGEADAVHQRHAEWFAQLAATADAQLRGADQLQWLARLEADHADLRAALQWLHDRPTAPDAEGSLRLASHLARFWSIRGYWSESERWLKLALLADQRQSAERALALLALAELTRFKYGFSESITLYEASLALYRALHDEWGIALASAYFIIAQDQAQAAQLFEDSLSRAQALHDNWLIASAYFRMGFYILHDYDVDAGAAYLEQGAWYARRAGDRWIVGSTLANLGEIARLRRDYDRAYACYSEALAIQRELDDRHGIAITLHNLGCVALHRGEYALAHSLFMNSLQHYQTLGRKRGLCECLAGLGGVAAGQQQADRAARLLAATRAQLALIKEDFDPADRPEFDRDVALARSQLSPQAFAAAWAAGEALTLDEAIGLAEYEDR